LEPIGDLMDGKQIAITVVQEHSWLVWAATIGATVVGGLVLRWFGRKR